MTTKKQLLGFLCCGELGPLEIGGTRNEIELLLGKPNDLSTFRKPLIWKYGPLQLTFDDTKQYTLAGIGLYTADLEEKLPPAFSDLGGDPMLSRHTTVQAMKLYLASHDIEFALDEILTSADQIVLTSGPGVSILFRDHGTVLDKILYITYGR